jgi:hypothetical protein
MRVVELFEARKSSSKNTKKVTLDQLTDIYEKHPNAFVTYTELPKFGANPHTKYKTPLGIYAYPLSYVVHMKGSVPYAGSSPYIFVFTPNPNGNYCNTLTSSPEIFGQNINGAMKKVLPEGKLELDAGDDIKTIWHKMYDAIHKHITNDITARFFELVAYDGSYAVIARKILRAAGYDGIIDPGLGIIHPNEKNQAVFFNTKNLNTITMIRNKIIRYISPEYYAPITTYGQWFVRLHHARATRTRDRTVENSAGKFVGEVIQKFPEQTMDALTEYAQKVIKGRWKEAEPSIIKYGKAIDMCIYASAVIKGRWKEAEPHIAKNPSVAVMYASLVIKGRWPEAESIINTSSTSKQKYQIMLNSKHTGK